MLQEPASYDKTSVSPATGVICLFCGIGIPVRRRQRNPLNNVKATPVSHLRCRACGKETLYLDDEIVEFQDQPSTAPDNVHSTAA